MLLKISKMLFMVFKKKPRKAKIIPLCDSELLYAVKYLAIHSDNDVFPKPFEYELIEKEFENMKDLLLNSEYIYGSQSRKFRYIFLPKDPSGLRIYHQLDPLHSICYFALVKKISSMIERKRVPLQEKIVFSHRLNISDDPLNGLYDKRYSYKEFNERTFEILENYNVQYVFFTDISDFYMRIYHHDLENSLLNIRNANTGVIKSIMKFLGIITNKETIGIPIGPEASHLLAELVLNEIDQILISKGILFCRYCDDFRFFCNDYGEAIKIREYFTEELYLNLKLTLNSNKTKIVPREEAEKFINATTIEYLSYNPSDDEIKDYLTSKTADDNMGNIDLSNLSAEDIRAIRSMDFSVDVLETENTKRINSILSLIKLGKDGKYAEILLNNINKYSKFIRPVCEYFKCLDDLSKAHYNILKDKFFSIIETSFIASSRYRKMFFLDVMIHNTNLAIEKGLLKNYENVSDIEKRKIILILNQFRNQEFFHSELKKIQNYCDPWVRRALFYGAQCVSTERRAFIRKNNPDIDEFEKIILSQ